MIKERFNSLLEGYVILHAIISSKNRMSFILKHTGGKNGALAGDDQLATRFLLYNPKIKPEKHGLAAFRWDKGIAKAWVGFLGDMSESTIICTNLGSCLECPNDFDLSNTVWNKLPNPTNTKKAMLRAIKGVVIIDKNIYMFGRFRKLYKKTSENKWEDLSYEGNSPSLHADLEKHKKQGRHLRNLGVGFSAIDGFSDNDIYCCGDRSDLWHYNGESWKRLDPPTNSDMTSILCAQDGYVYVGMGTGDVLKGRYEGRENWELIRGDCNEIHSLAWFQGNIYIGSELGLYTIEKNGKIKKYSFPKGSWHQYSFRNVASCNEALLSYGHHQALLFDGKKWDQIAGNIVVPQ